VLHPRCRMIPPPPSTEELVALLRAPHNNADLADLDKNGLLSWMTEELEDPLNVVAEERLARGTGKSTSVAMFAACAALADGGCDVQVLVPTERSVEHTGGMILRTLEHLQQVENGLDFRVNDGHVGPDGSMRLEFRGPRTRGSIRIDSMNRAAFVRRDEYFALTLVDEYAYLGADGRNIVTEMSERAIYVGTPLARAAHA
jgi:hypothetical protein